VRRVPLAAMDCIVRISETIQGAQALLDNKADVVRSLTAACQDFSEDPSLWQAQQQVAHTMAMVMRTGSRGIAAALRAEVPACIVALANEALFGDSRGSAGAAVMRNSCRAKLSHDADGRSALRRASGIPVLSFMLDMPNVPTVAKALEALMGITLDAGSKVPTIQVRSSALMASALMLNWLCAKVPSVIAVCINV
jgi:hypothetical protein